MEVSPPLLTAFYSRGSEPCSGWIDVWAFPQGLQMHGACLRDRRLKYLECLCVELISRISYALPMTTAECNGEAFLLQFRSLHTICLAGQHVDTCPASLSTGAFVAGKGIKTSSLSFKLFMMGSTGPHLTVVTIFVICFGIEGALCQNVLVRESNT